MDEPYDFLLAAFVNVVNGQVEPGLTFPITLTVSGLVVTGFIAPVSEYLEHIASTCFDVSQLKGGVSMIDQGMASHRDLELDSDRPVHVHLRDAVFHQAGNIGLGQTRVGWWRGRIADVNGWSMGMVRRDGDGQGV